MCVCVCVCVCVCTSIQSNFWCVYGPEQYLSTCSERPQLP